MLFSTILLTLLIGTRGQTSNIFEDPDDDAREPPHDPSPAAPLNQGRQKSTAALKSIEPGTVLS